MFKKYNYNWLSIILVFFVQSFSFSQQSPDNDIQIKYWNFGCSEDITNQGNLINSSKACFYLTDSLIHSWTKIEFNQLSTSPQELTWKISEENGKNLQLIIRSTSKNEIELSELGSPEKKHKLRLKNIKYSELNWSIERNFNNNKMMITVNKALIYSTYTFNTHLTRIEINAFNSETNPLKKEIKISSNKNIPAIKNCENKRELIKELNFKGDIKNPVISPDEKSLYFSVDNKDGSGEEIYRYEIIKSQLSERIIHPGFPLNNSGPNYVISVSPDENKLFIGNNYNSDGSPSSDGISVSEKSNSGWTLPYPIQIQKFKNLNKTQSFFMSSDEKKLIIAMENKKSKGGKDLYVCFKIKESLYTEPLWLGDIINSETEEFNPVLLPDNKSLLFASYGNFSFGSADLFLSQRLDDTWENWTVPENLGPCINSEGWDGGISLFSDRNRAIIASEFSETGTIKLYEVELPKDLIIKKSQKINIYTLDKKIRDSISGKLTIQNKTNPKESQQISTNGSTSFFISENEELELLFEAKNYFSYPLKLRLDEDSSSKNITVYLEIQKLEKGYELEIPGLEFSSNEFSISEVGKTGLKHLANYLLKNENITIKIIGNADKIGSEERNEELSQQRALEVYQYLKNCGVPIKRMKYSSIYNQEENKNFNREVRILID